jgi:hypothetical protein
VYSFLLSPEQGNFFPVPGDNGESFDANQGCLHLLHHAQDRRGWLRISHIRQCVSRSAPATDLGGKQIALQIRQAAWVGEQVQPVVGGLGEAEEQGAAARRSHAREIGLAKDFRAEGVGDNEPGLERRELDQVASEIAK